MHQRLPCKGEKHTSLANDKCPCCEQKETQEHFEQCPQNVEKYTDLLIKISQLGNKNKIDPVIIKLIERAFKIQPMKENALCREEPTIKWDKYRSLLKQQDKIGWKKIARGFFAAEWDEIQWRYERSINMMITILYG